MSRPHGSKNKPKIAPEAQKQAVEAPKHDDGSLPSREEALEEIRREGSADIN